MDKPLSLSLSLVIPFTVKHTIMNETFYMYRKLPDMRYPHKKGITIDLMSVGTI